MGRKFTDQAIVDALGPDWVDTPAKFPAINWNPDIVNTSVLSNFDAAEIEATKFVVPKRKRGRPRKETV